MRSAKTLLCHSEGPFVVELVAVGICCLHFDEMCPRRKIAGQFSNPYSDVVSNFSFLFLSIGCSSVESGVVLSFDCHFDKSTVM